MNHTSPPTDESQKNGHEEDGAVSRQMPPLVEETAYYTIEGEEENPDGEYVQKEAPSAECTPPFELSGELPIAGALPPRGIQANGSPASWRGGRKFPIRRVLVLLVAILIVGSLFLASVFAKPAMPSQQNDRNGSTVAPRATTTLPKAVPTQQHHQSTTPTPRPMVTPTVGATSQGTPQVNEVPSNQSLQQLGWTTAGLTLADALQADRTAVTFTDREEDLVFNKAGTRTAAFFLLTPAAKNRFTQNDVRVSSNALWGNVIGQRLIQLAINEQPALVKQAAQGQNQFAWVDVPFNLWRSRIDSQHPNQRIEGIENDPATNVPRTYHMVILLLLTPGSQGINAPMGGTGWLVSNYVLDPAAGALPDIVSPA